MEVMNRKSDKCGIKGAEATKYFGLKVIDTITQ